MPYVTEEIYQGLFAQEDGRLADSQGFPSIHTSPWPEAHHVLEDDDAEQTGALLVEIATAARRFKSEHNLSLGTELRLIQLAFVAAPDAGLLDGLESAEADLKGITRARQITFTSTPDPASAIAVASGSLTVQIFLD
jgi:valyl-tRNA synthetase